MADAAAVATQRPAKSTHPTDPARLTKPSKPGKQERRRARTGWIFVAPFTIVFLIFLVAPLLYALYMSLYNKGLATGGVLQFVGIQNYIQAFTDPQFLSGVGFVFLFALVLIPVQMIISLVIALVLDAIVTRFTRFARLMVFLPYAVPAVIGALMWGFLYSPTFGPLEQLFGPHAPFPLGPDYVFYGLMNVVTWQWAGYYMIIIYAALRGVDPTLYEAARIDGANAWQVAVRIKIPLVSSSLVLILVFALIGTLQFFTEPQILTDVSNGTIGPSFTPNIYAYNQAFQYSNVNYASALSFALGIVVFICVYIFLFATRRRGGFLR